MLYAQIQGLELMAQAESDKESCFMMGYHDSRSAVAKRFVLTGLLPCWARIGQFYAEVACREVGAVFLDRQMPKTGRINVLLNLPPRELLTTKTLWENDGSRSQHQRS